MQGTTSQVRFTRSHSMPTQSQSKAVLTKTYSAPNLTIESQVKHPKKLKITDANAKDIFKILDKMVIMQMPFTLLFKLEVKNNSLNFNKNIYKDISEMKDDVSLDLSLRDSHPIERFPDEKKKDIYEAVRIVKSFLTPIKQERAKVLGQRLEPETVVILHSNLPENHFFRQKEAKRQKRVLNDTFRQIMSSFKESELLTLQKPIKDFSEQERKQLNDILEKVIAVPPIKGKDVGKLLKSSSDNIQTTLKKSKSFMGETIVSGKSITTPERFFIKRAHSADIERINKAIEVYCEPTISPLEGMIDKGIEENLNMLLDAFKTIEDKKDNVRQKVASADEKKDIQMLMLGLIHKDVKEQLLNNRVPFSKSHILPFFDAKVQEAAKKLLQNFEAHPDNICRLYRRLEGISTSDIAFHIVSSFKKSSVQDDTQEASTSATHEETKTPEIQEVIDKKGKAKADA